MSVECIDSQLVYVNDTFSKETCKKMEETDLEVLAKHKCKSISIVERGDGVLEGPYYTQFDYKLSNNRTVEITVDQNVTRKIVIVSQKSVAICELLHLFTSLEHLLMLFDGMFYSIEKMSITGDDTAQKEYELCSDIFRQNRPSYFRTETAYRYKKHLFIQFDKVLSSVVFCKWIALEKELDIVHQMVLYNIADTGVTHDIKCAYLIESFESIAELVGLYEPFFPTLKQEDRKTTLRMCVDSVISLYGRDVFKREYETNKDEFLKTVVNSRHRIMHIKRNQLPEKYLSGKASLLYLIKFLHLYRIVLISMLGIDYGEYRTSVVDSINSWNQWEQVLDEFLDTV